ncbi:A/G-specific adenine glycosylase [Aquimarina brevivitae]|uniref:Adenine DNA glycosylase n=1 Tax=Aquimarina brevivitae TaxID=323412 RepID=A0A4Q7PIE2_9FLAO|nr:A/G-specific adenine glycosylase [Aquimarina brevivitae]RZS99580.1 A/G-specific DNA-adenine glycosylase [Aquimarina brevivitae]
MIFYKKLITWYLQNKRSLPWRKTKDPYKIWLSEIILQQTRVAQGLPYYNAFVAAYPTVYDLAAAKEEEVLKLWQGLGYYSRARNLHATANYVTKELKGQFPKDYKGLLTLKGVGDYTASAIASICYDEATPVVDGNVYRVLSRFYGVHTPINSTKGVKEFKKLATEVMDPKQPAIYNQAIMEFGAVQCKPKSPDCPNCPLHTACVGYKNADVDVLPVKEKKIKVKKRFFHYIVYRFEEQTILKKRTNKGIWFNLYEFPLLECDKILSVKELKKRLANKDMITDSLDLVPFNQEPVVHKLSHQHLYTKFYIVEVNKNRKTILNNQQWISIRDIEDYPVPVLIGNFMERFF